MADNNHSEPLSAEKSTPDDAEMQENDSDEEEFNADNNESDDEEAEIEKELSSSPKIETLAVRAEVRKECILRRHESRALKIKVRGSHQEALENVIAQASQDQVQNQLQSPACPPPSSSAPSPNTQEQALVPVANGSSLCVAAVNRQNASDHISVFSSPIVRKHATDDYNWRKYGQKQVKSPQGSRSYYRCTCTQCYAKKIECCDHSNLIKEVIYKGEHNHDPPKKVNRGRESKAALCVTPISVISNTNQPVQALMYTDPSTSSKVVKHGISLVTEMKRPNSISSDGDEFKDKEEHTDDPEPKQRAKKSSSVSPLKTAKRPKLVVRTACDMGISGDGYRWRKYGQKMVKGNPHPRNYYRCTSAGCPVRKHIERAIDSSTALTITYTGTHDHETPVTKKQHGTSSGRCGAAASPAHASVNNSQTKKDKPLSNQVSPTQLSVTTEGGLSGEELKVGEKPVDPTPALLSIGV